MCIRDRDIIVQMIKRCGDQYRIVRHKRNTRLTFENKPYALKKALRKGAALIVFSKKSVLALAAHLENQGCLLYTSSCVSETAAGGSRRGD